LRDAEGDILNGGISMEASCQGFERELRTVPFPDYSPATLQVPATSSQFWRVLNASAITYVDLQLLFKDRPQMLGVVALDGAPLNQQAPRYYTHFVVQPHYVAPVPRAEFIMKLQPVECRVDLVTRRFDTGPAEKTTPTRPLMTIVGAKKFARKRYRETCTCQKHRRQ